MKKYFLGSLGVISVISPLVLTLSCGDTSAKSIIDQGSKQIIQNELSHIAAPLGNLNVGRKLTPTVTTTSAQKVIISKLVKVTDIVLQQRAVGTTNWVKAMAGTTIQSNYEYNLEYGLTPQPGVQWGKNVTTTDPTGELLFAGATGSSKAANKTLDPKDFDGSTKVLDFGSSLDRSFKTATKFEDLKIDSSKAQWANKVTLKLSDFQTAQMGGSTWTPAQPSDVIKVGMQIKAQLTVTPIGDNAWTTGDEFQARSFTIINNSQMRVQGQYLKMNLSSVYVNKGFDISLFQGWWHDAADTNVPAGQEKVQVGVMLDAKQVSNDPASYTYQTVKMTTPAKFDPQSNEIYMTQKINYPLQKSDNNKYLAVKVTYKNFFVKGAAAPYNLYDKMIQGLKVDDGQYNRVVQAGNDLIVYSYQRKIVII